MPRTHGSRVELRESDLVRFWGKVALPDEHGCMLWTAAISYDGYGLFSVNRSSRRAHRLALIYFQGQPDDQSLDAAHSCRNRNCVAPAHLRWATRHENLLDRVSDGTDNAGSRHGMAKMDEQKVAELRRLAGEHSYPVLSQMFGISIGQISEIVNRKQWTHVA